MKPIVGLKELSRRTGISTRTLRRHVAMGFLPCCRLNKRVILFDPGTVEQWLVDRFRASEPPEPSDLAATRTKSP